MMSNRPCPACDVDASTHYGTYRDEEYFSSHDEFEYRQCTSCGTVYIGRVPSDRLPEIYPPNYYSFSGTPAGIVQRVKSALDARQLRRIMAALDGEALSALDIGGGTGWLLDLVRRIDRRVTRTQVVDLDAGAASIAIAKGHSFACQRIETFEPTQPFDLVLMLNLIEHVDEPRRVMEAVGRMLRPGARVLVKTPNIDALDARLYRGSYWAGLHVPRHWTLFNRRSFETMLRGSGLDVLEFSYTQGAPFWAASLLASLARRGLVDLSSARPAPYHPLFGPLSAAFAAFDIARGPLARCSQMFFLLGNAPRTDASGR